MRRWLLFPVVIGIAALAAYAVLTGPMPGVSSPPKDGRGVARSKAAAPAAREPAPKRNLTSTPVHHKDIREPSRERLREILREADGEEGR